MVHEFYRLKALITLEQVTTSVVEKKNNLNEQNFEVYWKTRIDNPLKKLEIKKMNKSWIVVMSWWAAGCRSILQNLTQLYLRFSSVNPIMFRYHNNLLPPPFLNLVMTNSQVYRYDTRTASNYLVHCCRTNIKNHNSLPRT